MKNKFGKDIYSGQFMPLADVAAATAYDFLITQALQDNYGPFTSLRLENNSSKAVQLVLDGGYGGAGTVQTTSQRVYVVPIYSIFEIKAEDGVLFYRAFAKNMSALTAIDIASTATEHLILDISNQTV